MLYLGLCALVATFSIAAAAVGKDDQMTRDSLFDEKIPCSGQQNSLFASKQAIVITRCNCITNRPLEVSK